MLVLRVTCHVVPCTRQRASFTVKISEPPPPAVSTFTSAVGSLLSAILLQPSLFGGAHVAVVDPDPWPVPLPLAGPHNHHAPAPSPITATATAPVSSQRRRRLVGTAGSPRSDRSKPSTSWCQVSSCNTAACRCASPCSASGRSAADGKAAPPTRTGTTRTSRF